MKRVWVSGVVAMVIGCATACIPAPSPAPYEIPPVVDSMSTPAPATPGSTTSIVIQAHDDQAISGLSISGLTTASGNPWPNGAIPCTSSTTHDGDDLTHGTVTVTCIVPTFANNGTWTVLATLQDNPGDGLYRAGLAIQIPFTVTGGSNDTTGPQLLSFHADPPDLVANTTMTLTARFYDETGTSMRAYHEGVILWTTWDPFSSIVCNPPIGAPSLTVVSPTLTDVTLLCNVDPSTAPPGDYIGTYDTIDPLGNTSTAGISGFHLQ